MIEAMAQEARVRADPNLRADRFVERWQGLKQERDRLYRAGDMAGRERTGKEMAGMAKSLERDPQVELVLRNRTRELGLEIGMGRGRGMNSGELGRELAGGWGPTRTCAPMGSWNAGRAPNGRATAAIAPATWRAGSARARKWRAWRKALSAIPRWNWSCVIAPASWGLRSAWAGGAA